VVRFIADDFILNFEIFLPSSKYSQFMLRFQWWWLKRTKIYT